MVTKHPPAQSIPSSSPKQQTPIPAGSVDGPISAQPTTASGSASHVASPAPRTDVRTPTVGLSTPATPQPVAIELGGTTAVTGPSVPSKRKRDRDLAGVGYTPLEISEIESRSAAFDLALALDQHSTLYPSPPTAFKSTEDAINRLLPYHVWQIDDDHLDKGLSEEQEMKQDAELVYQLVMLRERFGKVRRREAQHPSDLPSLINIIQQSTAEVREEVQALQATLRLEKGKLDVYEAEERRKREAALAREREKQRAEEEARKRQEAMQRAQALAAAQAQAQAEAAARAQAQAQAAALAQQQAAAAYAARPPSTPRPPSVVGQPAPPGTPGYTPGPAPVRPPPPGTRQGMPSPIAGQSPTTPSGLVVRPPAPSPAPVTPMRPSTPTMVPIAGGAPIPGMASTPSGPSTPTASPAPRGRPRGRPRGSGRGGLRQTVLTHAQQTAGSAMPPTPGSAPPAPTPQAPVIPSAPDAKTPQPPVTITIPMTLVPQFVQSKILVIPADPAAPKPPATVLRTSEDKKNVILQIDLAACNQQQIQTIARSLNVHLKPAGGSAPPAGAAAGNGVAPVPPNGAAPVAQAPSAPPAPTDNSLAPPAQGAVTPSNNSGP